MMRLALALTPFLSALLFPYPFTLLLLFLGSLAFPPTGILAGLFIDALYYPGTGLPLALILGALASLIALLVHRFVKARIMDA